MPKVFDSDTVKPIEDTSMPLVDTKEPFILRNTSAWEESQQQAYNPSFYSMVLS